MHRIRPWLLHERVHIAVVGCGASGSAIMAGLPYLHQSLLAFGHPHGLHVTVIDGDTVSPANCVRQPFSESDVGLSKAVVLVSRINAFWGLQWDAIPRHLELGVSAVGLNPHILIGCVDTRAARRVIRQWLGDSGAFYWMDLGNNTDNGQVVIGEPVSRVTRDTARRLLTVADLYPELIDPSLDDDALPSCSAAEALTRQAPFINQILANHALSMLARLFRTGTLEHHVLFVNPRTGHAQPQTVPAAAALTSDDIAEVRKLWKSKAWTSDDVEDVFDLQQDERAAYTEPRW